jgi:photosystem II stability/assembly factor-like uncharacterized protein
MRRIKFNYAIPVYCVIGIVLLLLSCNNNGNRQPADLPANRNWTLIGPGGGGATFLPTFSWNNAEDFLIRCDMTGSYLTKDGGDSYHQINFANGASGFAYHPKDSNCIYVGSATLNRSNDGGKTWEVLFPKKKNIIKEFYEGDHANYGIKVNDSSIYDTLNSNVGNIRVDPALEGAIYFSMGQFFFYSFDNGKSWKREDCAQKIDFIYAGRNTGNEVFIFTSTAQYRFDKKTGQLHSKDYPSPMSPAFSFTGGKKRNADSLVFFAIHHDTKQQVKGEFGYSEIWMSDDMGNTWKHVSDPIVENSATGIKPSYAMIRCAELDADNVYLITNRYQQKKDTTLEYWYGALKSADGGKSWQWCWKGGGGSGQYGVKDGEDANNLSDAWVKKAFGGEYIRLIDVGVYPADGNTAIVTDWYRTMKTVDGGKTWQQIYSNKRPDGTFQSRGLEVTTTYGVHFDPFDSNHIAIRYTDIC